MGRKRPEGGEALFCRHFAATGNAREAAVLAGYDPAEAAAEAAELLGRADIRKECARAAKELEELAPPALRGLYRLAFGSFADAVRLLYLEEPDVRTLETLDLFCVSELKRPKAGGVEIKFHDRQRALEAILAHGSGKAEGGAAALCQALERSAEMLRGDGDAL